jgi:DNA modification methylase
MIKLMHGDCLDLMRTIEPGSVDLIATDLPYGTTACKWDSVIPFELLWDNVKRVLKPSGAFVTTSSQPFTSFLVTSNPKWFRSEIIWKKTRGGGFLNANRMPLKRHENIIVFSKKSPIYNPQKTKGTPYKNTRRPGCETVFDKTQYEKLITTVNTGDRFPESVISVASEVGLHPTQKPVALYEWIIRTYSNPGDIVFDPCMGGGTTGEACVNTGRHFIGIEKERKYYDIACKRLGVEP